MGTSDRTADQPLDEGPSKKSLFSLLSLPLRSRTRNRNLAEFFVQVDDPHRQYAAGDHVTGSVILSVIKPVRLTHLTVCLHGFVRVFKNAAQVSATSPPVVASDSSNKNFRYFGNGHAQLFQDEQVLCGEGRLEARRWEFKFDLIFPEKGLPSSIDFERGTISYMITATLTRPTSIAPTTSAERKISLIEKVDVGLVPLPRERKVTMHAMHRRQKKKRPAAPVPPAPTKTSLTTTATSEVPETASDLDSTRANENSNEHSLSLDDSGHSRLDDPNIPRSPIHSDMQSEISGGSAVSHNSNSARGPDGSGGGSGASKASTGAVEDREITATVELLKGGCLPGDLLPVRIKIDHNRRVKSMHGIIVTFYRQGRVDYAPPTTSFSNLSKEDALKLEREEFYPKSRTGLGGLSLSSAGSCSVFRKDLSQAVAPLIIDPRTLSANITTSVRVPEDVFPSIKGVPGGLITFKYHIEVVVDLGGRLAGQSQGTAQQPGRMNAVSLAGSGASGVDIYTRQLSRLANWNGTVVDTDHLRREKGVISVAFEVVVGNMDTSRTRSKPTSPPALTLQPPTKQNSSADAGKQGYPWPDGYDEHIDYDENGSPWTPTPYDQTYNYYGPGVSPQYHLHGQSSQIMPAPEYIPPPQVPDQNGLSEKELARQAEQRLLPSQPGAPSGGPSAGPSHPPMASDSTAGPSASEPANDASAPTEADLHQAANSNHTDDKQELERRRLLAEASGPPEIPDDYEAGGPSAPPLDEAGPSIGHEPSAPILDEESHDPYESIAGPASARGPNNTGADDLPKYER